MEFLFYWRSKGKCFGIIHYIVWKLKMCMYRLNMSLHLCVIQFIYDAWLHSVQSQNDRGCLLLTEFWQQKFIILSKWVKWVKWVSVWGREFDGCAQSLFSLSFSIFVRNLIEKFLSEHVLVRLEAFSNLKYMLQLAQYRLNEPNRIPFQIYCQSLIWFIHFKELGYDM
jgi:hypothetical protein